MAWRWSEPVRVKCSWAVRRYDEAGETILQNSQPWKVLGVAAWRATGEREPTVDNRESWNQVTG